MMQRFQAHAERFNTEIVFDHIHTAKLTEKPMTLIGDAQSHKDDEDAGVDLTDIDFTCFRMDIH